MKKLSTLLARRPVLLQQVRLANLAFAYSLLSRFAQRIARARLVGGVTLRPAAPTSERYWPTLTPHEGNASVLEEHFTEEDLMELADVLAFATGSDTGDISFRLEELSEAFVTPLRAELEREGIVVDQSDAHRDVLR